jgi:phage terminase large subunit-like protein
MNQVVSSYAGSRLGMQEIEGIMLFDSENALWNTEMLDKCRREKPEIKLFAIGVDPQSSKEKEL